MGWSQTQIDEASQHLDYIASETVTLVARYSEPPVDVDGNRLRYNGDYEVVFSPIPKE